MGFVHDSDSGIDSDVSDGQTTVLEATVLYT